MMKLLTAGFSRLCKSRLYLGMLIASSCLALVVILTRYHDMKKYGDIIEVDQLMLNYSVMVGIVIAIFIGLFLGTEYADGTIRNKIVTGHKRIAVYSSNLILMTLAGMCFYLVYFAIVTVIGIPLFGTVAMPTGDLLKILGCILLALMAYSGIVTFITMMISHKAVSAIVSIMIAFILMMLAINCLEILDAQEYVSSISMVNGEMVQEVIRNPNYPSAEKREVFQILCNLNPTGQMVQLANKAVDQTNVMPLYSLGIWVLFTVAGIVELNKKEIK